MIFFFFANNMLRSRKVGHKPNKAQNNHPNANMANVGLGQSFMMWIFNYFNQLTEFFFFFFCFQTIRHISQLIHLVFLFLI